MIDVISITDHDDGSATIDLEISDEGMKIFLDISGLEEFDQDEFQKFFIHAIENYLKENQGDS